jgi:membrane protease YdiL (CAAX protease family)
MKNYRLRDHISASIIIVILLYLITVIISESVIRIINIDSELLNLFLKIIFYSFLCFIIIPIWLNLPRGHKTYGEYLKDIRIANYEPPIRIILLIFASYCIIMVSQLIGSYLYYLHNPGEYIFDISRHSLFDSGQIIASVFEEILWRGIILTVLLVKYSELKSILISSAIFGGIHILNLGNPEQQTFWVLSQVIWAFGLGIMYAYLTIKSNSIWVPIVLHYLINAFVGVWFISSDNMDLTYYLYSIVFFGVLPALIVVYLVKYFSKNWSYKNAQPAT